MIKIKATKIYETIEGRTEQDFPLFIADNPDEIILKHWGEYQQRLEQCEQVGQDKEVEDIGLYYKEVASLLSCFVFKDEQLSKRVELGDLFQIQLNDIDHSFESVLILIIKNISNYDVSPIRQFDHKGQTFFLPQSSIDALGNVKHGAKLSTLEAVQAMQFDHVFNKVLSDGTKLEDRRFRTDLALLATLCRKVLKDGSLETLPFETDERDRFTFERMKLFEDVPLSVSLAINFFLQVSNSKSKKGSRLHYTKAKRKRPKK